MIAVQFPGAFQVGCGPRFLGFPHPKQRVFHLLDWFCFVELTINSFKRDWLSDCMDQALTMVRTAEQPLLNPSICLRSLEKSFVPGWNIWLVTERERIWWRKGMSYVFMLPPAPKYRHVLAVPLFKIWIERISVKCRGEREKSWRRRDRQLSTDASQLLPCDGAVTEVQTWHCTQRVLSWTLLQFWMRLGTNSSQTLSIRSSSAPHEDLLCWPCMSSTHRYYQWTLFQARQHVFTKECSW